MEGHETVNGMSNGKDIGVNRRSERQSVREKSQRSVARASRDVIDLGLTTGQSPGKRRSKSLEKQSSSRRTKCRIKVIAVTCSEASDVVRRLERICALLIGKVGSDV